MRRGMNRLALAVGVVVVAGGLACATPSLAERLGQRREWVIGRGQHVVIEGLDVVCRTNFFVRDGGKLSITDSRLDFVGEHHHDNYIAVEGGTVVVENSRLLGEPEAPFMLHTNSSRSSVYMSSSTITDGHVQLRNGGDIELVEVHMAGMEFWQTREGVEQGASLRATRCTVTRALHLRFGEVSGTITLEDLNSDIGNFSFQHGRFEVAFVDCEVSLPMVENNGAPPGGSLTLHILNSRVGEITTWERGDVIVEDSVVCAFVIRHHESRNVITYSGLEAGYFEDELLIDQPTRRVRFINSTLVCHTDRQSAVAYDCPKHGIQVLGVFAPLEVADSHIGQFRIGPGLAARSVTVENLILYQATGTVLLDECYVGWMDVVRSANVQLRGAFTVGRKEELFDWGGWEHLSITRWYPIEVRDDEGAPMTRAVVELLNPQGRVVWRGWTNRAGAVDAPLMFGAEDHLAPRTLRIEALGITHPIGLLSPTPVFVSPGGVNMGLPHLRPSQEQHAEPEDAADEVSAKGYGVPWNQAHGIITTSQLLAVGESLTFAFEVRNPVYIGATGRPDTVRFAVRFRDGATGVGQAIQGYGEHEKRIWAGVFEEVAVPVVSCGDAWCGEVTVMLTEEVKVVVIIGPDVPGTVSFGLELDGRD